MEEETSEEWKADEYESDGGNSKMSSVIWRVGKKIVISGIVITSAPFVLPPVLLVSTVGFAFAVPFGLVLASYACTEKIMSKLLPLPSSPSEYGEEGVGGMDMEEEEFEEDVKKTLEMRTQRIEDEDVNGSVEEDEKGNERGKRRRMAS
ncbi:hypothetical protein IFM89_023120 [Coptis chinensis]|uniref:Uncharacterized protein n=1 Tax=Coptis chinensis TaxID=261450 RepID=A0A835LV38_9MAGN|nr:hypothetical protein IFM89_023120 [Coptis chinensis]